MEGSPTSTEDIIYFKMYLKGFNNISQTIKNEMNNNIRVSYYLCLEICDSENRNFFKKIEINLFRLPEEYYNKLRQNILEGKLNNNIYEINDVNKDKKNINNKMNKKQENKNKKSKIKNLFANIKNPLTDNINIENNDNENDDNQNEKNNNNIIINNNNKNNDKINKEEVKQKQKKKKISSLFNSDFD